MLPTQQDPLGNRAAKTTVRKLKTCHNALVALGR